MAPLGHPDRQIEELWLNASPLFLFLLLDPFNEEAQANKG